MTNEATVDPQLCIGSGDCTRLAQAAFQLDESAGVAVAIPAGVRSTDPAILVDAARGCPTQAIRVVRDGIVLHEAN